MPRTYKRISKKAEWNQENLSKAMEVISKNKMSIRKAAQLFGIPYSTLQERIKKGSNVATKIGRKTDIPTDLEIQLAERVKLLGKIFYGVSALQMRKNAFRFAEECNVNHRFNKVHRMAGKDWLAGFLTRHNISVRKPEAISINRITGFNREEVGRFFNNLHDMRQKYSFQAGNIWNMDETGISTVQDPGMVLATTGQCRVGSLTSWERGKNITVVCAMSVAGQYCPPLFIFPRKRMSIELQRNGLPGASYNCSKSGWITEELFVHWLEHFIQFTKPSDDRKVLLVLDNHSSHCTIEAYELCRKHNIVMLSLPPHCSHRMQPLDVSFFGPLKKRFKYECDVYMKSKCLEKITPYIIAELFGKAYAEVASMTKGIEGFRATGIEPLNRFIFTDEDFLPETLLNPPLPLSPLAGSSTLSSTTIPSTLSPIVGPSTTSPPLATLLSDILPIPKPQTTCDIKKKSSRKQHSQILTLTPMKEVLKLKQERKLTLLNRNTKNGGKKNLRKKKLNFQSDNSDISDENVVHDICSFCKEFGKGDEMWFRCTVCGQWAHEECSGWDTPEEYICDICTN